MIETRKKTRGIIRETGNGLPDDGEIVMASEGTLYRIGRSTCLISNAGVEIDNDF